MNEQDALNLITKNYISHTPNSGYVDAQGRRHVFAPYGRLGRISTANAELQKELDGAINGGAPFRHQIDADIPEMVSSEAAAEIADKDAEIAQLKEQLAQLQSSAKEPAELSVVDKIEAAKQELGALNSATGSAVVK